MPSLTEYFGYGITNFGPLTTTFTAPSSCATETTDRIYYANSSNLAIQFGNPKCQGGYVGDCFPSGSAYDDYVTSYWERPIHAKYPYFSPGLVCPHGWTTVGTFALAGNTSSIDATGVFTKDPFEGFSGTRARVGPNKIWSNALKPSETLAYCCPSGYTGVNGGACYSALGPHEDYDYKSVCRAFYPDDALTTVYTVEGTPVTQGVYSVAPVTEKYTTTTVAIADVTGKEEAWGDWVVATVYPAVALVYQETDVAKAKEQGGSEGEDKDDSKDGDDENAASALSARGVAPMLAVAVGMLAGAGLLMPW
ncbi:hypothetical protein CEP53_006837 [Fusarium sp. AF-6]|nr:hypothetical protein CEP53_006837 [Fusarium sp. AF-6]